MAQDTEHSSLGAEIAPRLDASAIDRRGFVIGAAAALGALGAPGLALAADGTRRFRLYRDKEDVGHHTISANKTANGLQVDIRIQIQIRRIGFRVYVFEMQNSELWRDGALVQLSSSTNNNGSKEFCRATRSGGGLKIEGSGFSGDAPASARPTSYWNYNNLSSKPWFSAQTGKLLRLRFRRSQQGPLETWSLSGDLNTTLIYDNRKEWVGCLFDAGGRPIVYRQVDRGPAFQSMV